MRKRKKPYYCRTCRKRYTRIERCNCGSRCPTCNTRNKPHRSDWNDVEQ